MELLILCIEFIIKKLDLSIAVTINTPAHTQIAHLSYPVHPFNGPMTGATFDLSNCYMLCMTEKDKQRLEQAIGDYLQWMKSREYRNRKGRKRYELLLGDFLSFARHKAISWNDIFTT